MKLQEAVDLLMPIYEQTGKTISIEPPAVWIWAHLGGRVEPSEWQVWDGDRHHEGKTLEVAVNMCLDYHRANPTTLEEIEEFAAVS